MLFLAAIDKFTKEDLVELTALAESASLMDSVREKTEAGLYKAKRFAGKAGRGAGRIFETLGNKLSNQGGGFRKAAGRGAKTIGQFNENLVARFDELQFSPYLVQKKLEQKRVILSELDESELRARFYDDLMTLGNVKMKIREMPEEVAKEILSKVAKLFKINIKMVGPEEVERLFFEKFLEDLIDKLRKKLLNISPEQETELEKKLRQVLARMGKGELNAIRGAVGLDELTAKGLISVFKSGGVTVATLTAMNAAGFGLFLAATTMIKAFSLLIGVTFGFGIYTAATTFLGFILNPFVAGFIIGSSIGVAGGIADLKYSRALLGGLVASMHAKLLSNTESKNPREAT